MQASTSFSLDRLLLWHAGTIESWKSIRTDDMVDEVMDVVHNPDNAHVKNH